MMSQIKWISKLYRKREITLIKFITSENFLGLKWKSLSLSHVLVKLCVFLFEVHVFDLSPFYKNKLQIYLLCIEKSDDVRQAKNQVIPSYGY